MDKSEFSEVNASAVKRMIEHPGWGELEREVLDWIEDIRNELEVGSVNDAELRGSAKALRRMLAWPSIVEDAASYGQNLTIDPDEDE